MEYIVIVRGSVQQTICQSYYFFKEMLQKENPKVVAFNVAEMKYEKTYGSSYTRMTLDGMRWSKYEAKAVGESLIEGVYFIEYVFPILFYHDRWKSLAKEKFFLYKRSKNFFQ